MGKQILNNSKKNSQFQQFQQQDSTQEFTNNHKKHKYQKVNNKNQESAQKLDESSESKIKFVKKQKLPKFLKEQELSNKGIMKQNNNQSQDQSLIDLENYDEEEVVEQKEIQPLEKRKTKKYPCKYFMLGQCSKSEDQCPFIHIQIPEIDEDQCQHFILNKCNQGQQCSKNHDEEYKSQFTKIIQMAVLIHQNQNNIQTKFKENYKKHPSVEKTQNSTKSIQIDTKEQFNQKLNQLNQMQEQIEKKFEKPQKISKHGKKELILNQNHKNKSEINNESETIQQISQSQLVADIPIQDDYNDLYTLIDQQQNYIKDPKLVEKKLQEYSDELLQMQRNPQKYIINERAMCLQMCPQSQIENQYRDQSRFEKNNKGELFEKLAIKKLVRSAAGVEDMDDPKIVRPPSVLFLTVKYLRDCLVDQDLIPPGQSFYQYQNQNQNTHKKFDIYAFMKDRTRQIGQDISFYKSKIQNEETIGCFEQMIRYLVLSFHDGMSEPNFENYTNMKQLTGFIGDLNEQYRFVNASKTLNIQQKRILLKNQAEIKSYHLICSADSLTEFQSVLKSIDFVRSYNQFDKSLINEAIQIAHSIQIEDFQRFFMLFKKTNYMFACLMLNFFDKMRSVALQVFRKSYFNSQSLADQDFLQKQLLLDEKYDYFNCLSKFGFKPEKNQKFINLFDRINKEHWEITIKKFRQIKNSKLDNYRKQYLRCNIMESGVHLNIDQQINSKQIPQFINPHVNEINQNSIQNQLKLKQQIDSQIAAKIKQEEEKKEKEQQELKLKQE